MQRGSCQESPQKAKDDAKKKTLNYIERSEDARREYEQETADIPVSRRIYIDESGVSQFCYRAYGRALRGERVHGFVPGRKFARVNVVAGYCDGRILGEYCYTGSTTAVKFETWFCDFLLPETCPGDAVFLDNASFHNKKRLRMYARVYKVTVIFLPPYSPDYNPIEHVWANMKRFLRNSKQQFHSIQSAIYWYFAMGPL